jgi:hypothetical protein
MTVPHYAALCPRHSRNRATTTVPCAPLFRGAQSQSADRTSRHRSNEMTTGHSRASKNAGDRGAAGPPETVARKPRSRPPIGVLAAPALAAHASAQVMDHAHAHPCERYLSDTACIEVIRVRTNESEAADG